MQMLDLAVAAAAGADAALHQAEIPAEELWHCGTSACTGEQHLWRIEVDLGLKPVQQLDRECPVGTGRERGR